MHWQATGLRPENDYGLSRKVEFMKRIRNTQIANKIIKSNHFKDYTRYSLQACFTRALEQEGDFQVGEVVTQNYAQAQVLAVEGEETPEIAVGDSGNDATPVTKQGTNPRVCITRMFVGGVVKWGILQEIVPTKILSRLRHWGDCTIHWRQRLP